MIQNSNGEPGPSVQIQVHQFVPLSHSWVLVKTSLKMHLACDDPHSPVGKLPSAPLIPKFRKDPGARIGAVLAGQETCNGQNDVGMVRNIEK